MDFLKLLKDSVPNAGPKSTQQVMDAQQKLEMLRVKNPQEAEVFSKQLAGTITSKGDPRSIFEGISKSYGASLGKQPTQTESGQPQEALKKEAGTAAAIAGINSLVEKSTKSGNNPDPNLIDAARKLAVYDPKEAMRMVETSTPVLPPAPKEPERKKSAADITFEQNANSAFRYANDLLDTIEKGGTWESEMLGDPQIAAKLNQLPYQMAIAYAKTVDPSSVAREGEVAAAKQYLIPLGMMKSKEVAKASIENFRQDIKNQMESYKKAAGVELEIPQIPEAKKEAENKEKTVKGSNQFFNKFKAQEMPATNL